MEKKWGKLTKRRVRFEWLGESELSDHLSQPLSCDLLVYWFGVPQFTAAWMDSVISSSIRNLDRRYSPKQHVDTEAGQLADIFAWSPTFTDLIKRSLLDLAEAWRKFVEALHRESFNDSVGGDRSALISAIDELLASEIPSADGRSVSGAMNEAQAALVKWEKMHQDVEELDRIATANKSNSTAPCPNYRYFLMTSDTLGGQLRQWHALLKRSALADKRRLLVLGEAGTGKSHLIASVVVYARKRGQPALLLLGEHFTAPDEPWSQAQRVIGWDASLEWLLSALNQAGTLANLPALVCIDALNESDYRTLWASHLNAFAAKIREYPFVRLIVSCRSDFAEITLPPHVAEGRDPDWAAIWHSGFGEEVFEAVANYFDGYGVKSTHFPPLIEEFRNPLFLRLFCEAFENQCLPDGPLTLERVMTARIQTLTVKLQQDIDCSADDVRSAIYSVAQLIRKNEGRAVERDAARAAVNAYSAERIHSRSLYTHLRSSGIFIEISERPVDTNPTVKVRFAFERFSDYFVAAELLSEIRSADELTLQRYVCR